MKKVSIKNTLFLAVLFGTGVFSQAMDQNLLGMPGAMSISLTPQSQKQKKEERAIKRRKQREKKRQTVLDKQLLQATKKGYTRRVKKLLENGAHVNARSNDRKETPLHKAAIRGRDPIVLLLIAAGANVDAKNIYGMTPLHCAAYEWNTNSIQLLLAYGADVFSKNYNNEIPLGLVAMLPRGDFLRWDTVEYWQEEKRHKKCRENIKVFITAPRSLLTPAERKAIYAILILNKRKYDKDCPFTWIPKDIIMTHILPYVCDGGALLRNKKNDGDLLRNERIRLHKEQVKKMLRTTVLHKEKTSWGGEVVLGKSSIMLSQAGMNMALQWCKEIEQAYEN